MPSLHRTSPDLAQARSGSWSAVCGRLCRGRSERADVDQHPARAAVGVEPPILQTAGRGGNHDAKAAAAPEAAMEAVMAKTPRGRGSRGKRRGAERDSGGERDHGLAEHCSLSILLGCACHILRAISRPPPPPRFTGALGYMI